MKLCTRSPLFLTGYHATAGGLRLAREAKVKRFVLTLSHVLTRLDKRVSSLESADLRHENGYAVRVRGLKTSEPLARK